MLRLTAALNCYIEKYTVCTFNTTTILSLLSIFDQRNYDITGLPQQLKIEFHDFLGHFPGLFKAISTGLRI